MRLGRSIAAAGVAALIASGLALTAPAAADSTGAEATATPTATATATDAAAEASATATDATAEASASPEATAATSEATAEATATESATEDATTDADDTENTATPTTDPASGAFAANGLESPVIDPATGALTVSGTGCQIKDGQVGSVSVVLAYQDLDTRSTPVLVDAAADGTWSATIDIAAAVAEIGADTNTDPWYLVAACAETNAEPQAQQQQVYLDGTEVSGDAIIVSSDTDGDGAYDTQTYDINKTGFTPGETVTFTIRNQDTGAEQVLVVLTADAEGRITGTGPMPAVADGRYIIEATGSRYGEGFTSKPITVTNGWYQVGEGTNLGDSATTTTTMTVTAAAKPATRTTTRTTTELANTGAGLGLVVVAAGLVASGAVLSSRRKS